MNLFRSNQDRDLLWRVEDIERDAPEICRSISLSVKGVSLATHFFHKCKRSADAPIASQWQIDLLREVDVSTLVFLARSCAKSVHWIQIRIYRSGDGPDREIFRAQEIEQGREQESEQELKSLLGFLQSFGFLIELEQLRRKSVSETAQKYCAAASDKLVSQMSEVIASATNTSLLPFSRVMRWASNDMDGLLQFLQEAKSLARRRGHRHVIYLVHGTWGRGIFPRPRQSLVSEQEAYWFEDGSHFRNKLQYAFNYGSIPVEFREFHWSGKNSFTARHESALALAKMISASGRAGGNGENAPYISIIAHSHGGNIALKATEYLPLNHDPVRLVTLATPFLGISRLPIERSARAHRWLYVCLMLGYFYWIYQAGLGPLFTPWKIDVWRHGISGVLIYSSAIVALVLPAAIFAYHSCRLTYFLWQHGHRDYLLEPALDPKRRLETLSVQTNTKLRHEDRLLIVRGTADEASLVMALSTIVGRLSTVMTEGFGRSSRSYIVNSILVAVLSMFGIDLLIGFPDGATGFERLLGIASASIGGVALLCFQVLLLSKLFSLAFGFEGWRLPFFSEVSARETPNANDNLSVLTLKPDDAGPGLRHAVYERTNFEWKIMPWLIRPDRDSNRDFVEE